MRLGTEVVSDDEGTVAALLGASPGGLHRGAYHAAANGKSV
ncbi:hypothetical protein [Stenotrophomonas maltophilia]